MTNANILSYIWINHMHTQKLAPRQGNTLGIAEGRGKGGRNVWGGQKVEREKTFS